jgi:hypothetical protein
VTTRRWTILTMKPVTDKASHATVAEIVARRA